VNRQKPSSRFTVITSDGVTEVGETEELLPTKLPLVDLYESQTYKAERVFDLPRPRYIVPKLLLENSIATIYGQKGNGKTHYSLALALEIARGGEWNGHTLKPRPVFYLVGEGSSSVVERLEAWKLSNKEDLPENFETGHLQPAPQLLQADQLAGFVELLQRRKWSSGVVFLDTFQSATVGLDEISGRDMGEAIEALKVIARETNSTVIIVHHAGKVLERGQRGHSSLGASVETEIEISQDSNSGSIKAKVVKMRTAPDGWETSYKLELVQLPPIANNETEADGDEYLLEWRSVPVLVPAQLPQARYKKQDERVLVNMLEGFDLPDGYKRTDVEKLLNISRSPAGNVLKKLKESELVTNFSPFTERESTSSYWLTTKGRELVEELLAREASRNRLQQGEDS
jgi:predicted transcriptional regulator